MTRDDFEECEYINYEMRFYSYTDFCNRHNIIRSLYHDILSSNGKIFYKWYLYSNVHISMNQKNRIWDYINGYADKDELFELLHGEIIERNN